MAIKTYHSGEEKKINSVSSHLSLITSNKWKYNSILFYFYIFFSSHYIHFIFIKGIKYIWIISEIEMTTFL